MNKIRLVVNNESKRNEKEKFFIKKELQSILICMQKWFQTVHGEIIRLLLV